MKANSGAAMAYPLMHSSKNQTHNEAHQDPNTRSDGMYRCSSVCPGKRHTERQWQQYTDTKLIWQSRHIWLYRVIWIYGSQWLYRQLRLYGVQRLPSQWLYGCVWPPQRWYSRYPGRFTRLLGLLWCQRLQWQHRYER